MSNKRQKQERRRNMDQSLKARQAAKEDAAREHEESENNKSEARRAIENAVRRKHVDSEPKTKLGQSIRARSQEADKLAKHDPFYRHRRAKRIGVVVGVIAMGLASGAGIAGIFNAASDATTWTKTGQVAATVMGENIMEDSITTKIMDTRTGSYDSDSSWAQYLVDQGTTPSKLREQYIDSYKASIILDKACKEYGITVTSADEEAKWDEVANEYGGDDTFLSTIENYGYTKSSYMSSFDSTIKKEKLTAAVVPLDGITDQDVIDYVNENASTYNGARKSSQILFGTDSDGSTTNQDQAASVLQQIRDGSLSFSDAVSQYSTDTTSAADGGNIGWDCDSSLIDAYETALKGLDKGAISDVVQSSYGYHIIECTDVLSFDGSATDINQIPDDIASSIRKNIQSSKYSSWYSDYESNADITINDMPQGLPYDVSLDGVTASSSSSASGQTVYEDGVATSSDSSAESEDTTDASETSNASESESLSDTTNSGNTSSNLSSALSSESGTSVSK